MKVLHITEALGGGVSTALEGYIGRAPEHEHVVAAYRRPGHDTGDSLSSLARIVSLPRPKMLQLFRVFSLIQSEQPDLIHAHSSFGGLYARLAPTRTPIAYTPHCFAFERTDVSDRTRMIYRTVESVLGERTAIFIANGPREAELCREVAPKQLVMNCPFSPRMLARSPHPTRLRNEALPLRVLLVGRVCPQKGVDFVVETAARLKPHIISDEPTIQIRWVGYGPRESVARLRGVGVDVAGWKSRAEVIAEMDSADVYFHAGAWEGFPVTVLEAGEIGLPVLARRIGALASTQLTLADDPVEAAKELLGMISFSRRVEESQRSRELAEDTWHLSQVNSLSVAYAQALGSGITSDAPELALSGSVSHSSAEKALVAK